MVIAVKVKHDTWTELFKKKIFNLIWEIKLNFSTDSSTEHTLFLLKINRR